MKPYWMLFRELGINAPARYKGQAKVTCPHCQQRKPGTRDRDLSVNFETGAYKCHSAKCNFQGYVRQPAEKGYSRPEFKNLTEAPDWVVKYLTSRGISTGGNKGKARERKPGRKSDKV
ncbi:MAG: hypothetical protein KatS3mg031_2904 [Chitinophagales bacterium]|nr:MAG: hypothetical protein KatS3mg031_2904 [Chitinophagales bacterium]